MLIRLRTKGGGLETVDTGTEPAQITIQHAGGPPVTRDIDPNGLAKITVVRSKKPKK